MTDSQSGLGIDLSGLETLSDMIGDHIVAALIPSRELSIALLGVVELSIDAYRVAFVGRNIFAFFSLFGVFHIFGSLSEGFGYAAATAGMEGADVGRSYSVVLLSGFLGLLCSGRIGLGRVALYTLSKTAT